MHRIPVQTQCVCVFPAHTVTRTNILHVIWANTNETDLIQHWKCAHQDQALSQTLISGHFCAVGWLSPVLTKGAAVRQMASHFFLACSMQLGSHECREKSSFLHCPLEGSITRQKNDAVFFNKVNLTLQGGKMYYLTKVMKATPHPLLLKFIIPGRFLIFIPSAKLHWHTD